MAAVVAVAVAAAVAGAAVAAAVDKVRHDYHNILSPSSPPAMASN